MWNHGNYSGPSLHPPQSFIKCVGRVHVPFTGGVRVHGNKPTSVTLSGIENKVVVEVKGRHPGSDFTVINIQTTSEYILPHNMLLEKKY